MNFNRTVKQCADRAVVQRQAGSLSCTVRADAASAQRGTARGQIGRGARAGRRNDGAARLVERDLTFASHLAAGCAMRMSNPRLHEAFMFARGSLIPTFAGSVATVGCKCWNRTTSGAGFDIRIPPRRGVRHANVESQAPRSFYVARGSLIPTFAGSVAAAGCKCWNRTTSGAGFDIRIPPRRGVRHANVESQAPRSFYVARGSLIPTFAGSVPQRDANVGIEPRAEQWPLDQRPAQRGARFSMKARGPSL
jgi:hypothetical protein